MVLTTDVVTMPLHTYSGREKKNTQQKLNAVLYVDAVALIYVVLLYFSQHKASFVYISVGDWK